MTVTTTVDDLFDFAMNHLEGFTREQACAELDISVETFRSAVRQLRTTLAPDWALPCAPGGHREQWVYRLSFAMDDCAPWARNRLADAQSRLATMLAMTQTLVRATDGRTRDGRIAREMNVTFRHLRERIDLLNETLS